MTEDCPLPRHLDRRDACAVQAYREARAHLMDPIALPTVVGNQRGYGGASIAPRLGFGVGRGRHTGANDDTTFDRFFKRMEE